MADCVFCKIVRGEIPAMRVYEDEHTLVFMDIAGDVDGHMLAIPKAHAQSLLDCEAETLTQLMRTVQKISQHLTENCGYEGVNLLNASGKCAGQSVPHFHIHVIPRKSGDGVDAWPVLPGASEDIAGLYDRLKINPAIAAAHRNLEAEESDGFHLHYRAQRGRQDDAGKGAV